MKNQSPQTKHSISPSIQRSILTLTLTFIITALTSCGDFIDPKEATPTPQTQEQPVTPEVPPEPVIPKPKPGETLEQKNWRLCEAERLWAFNARLIDSNAYQLYQKRNFAPIFNTPGERQSGIEGWYPCAHALEVNEFVDPHSETE